MRLICPNCDAQYEVPDDVIPQDGRDVQCSNCGNTWFVPHPDMQAAAEAAQAAPLDDQWEPDDPAEAPTPAPEAGPAERPRRRAIEPEVADVLRQEAEHEAQVRAAESGGLESQPDLGLAEPKSDDAHREREAQQRMARLRGEPAEAAPAAIAAASGTRRDLLPDIDEINSTLRSTGDRKAAANREPAAPAPAGRARGRGFRLGFGLILLVGALGFFAYAYAPRLKEAVPQAAPMVDTYVAQVNEWRVWLDGRMTEIMLWLDSKSSTNAPAPAPETSPPAGADPVEAEPVDGSVDS